MTRTMRNSVVVFPPSLTLWTKNMYTNAYNALQRKMVQGGGTVIYDQAYTITGRRERAR